MADLLTEDSPPLALPKLSPSTGTLGRLLSTGMVSAISTLLGLLTVMYLARRLQTAQYGQMIYYLNWMGILRLLMSLGLGTRISKTLSEGTALPSLIRERFYSLLAVRIVAVILVGIIASVASEVFHMPVLVWGFGLASVAVILDFAQATLAGLLRVGLLNIVSMCQPLFYVIGVVAVGALVSDLDIDKVMTAYGLSLVGSLSIAVLLLWRASPWLIRYSKISWRYVTQSSRFIGMVYLLALLSHLYNVGATTLIGLWGNFEQVASFGIPFNLVMLPIGTINFAIVSVCYPKMCESPESAEVLDFFLRAATHVGLGISIVFVGYSREILSIVYTSKYLGSSPVLMILGPMVLLRGIEGILVYAFIARDQPLRPILAYLLQIGILLAGLWGFAVVDVAPQLGNQLLAWCFIVGTTLSVLYLWLVLQKQSSFTMSPYAMLRNAIPPVCAAAAIVVLQRLLPESRLAAIGGAVIVVVVYAGALYITGSLEQKHPWIVGVHRKDTIVAANAGG